MSDYSDVYEKVYGDVYTTENLAKNLKERLINELSSEQMIKIMFTDFINKKHDNVIFNLAHNYLKEDINLPFFTML